MTARRWMKFWPQDWQRDPALRACSIGARGLWMELICIAHDAEPYGHVTINGKPISLRQMSSICGANEKECGRLLTELEDAGVFSRTHEGTIYSRRMVRDAERSEEGREAISKRWDRPNKEPNTSPNRVTDRDATDDPDSLEARSKKQEAREERRPRPSVSPSSRASPRAEADREFEVFWSEYPRKVGKGAARKAWVNAVRRASPDEITAGIRQYAFNSDPSFQPHAATWLNQDRWIVGADTPPPTVIVPHLPSARMSETQRFRAQLDTLTADFRPDYLDEPMMLDGPDDE